MADAEVSGDVTGSTVATLLAEAADLPGDEARREAEVLLAHCMVTSRSALYAWPEAAVPAVTATGYRQLLDARRRGTPLAYLLGEREFWSLALRVNPSVLIPRPDTERLVELALQQPLPAGSRVLDVGTGSGAIALAVAAERRDWQLTGVDISADALAVATDNGMRLGLSVRWAQGDWFEPVANERFAMILSNPPYIDSDDPHLRQGDLRFEPPSALIAGEGGLAALRTLIDGAQAHLEQRGLLLLEHGCTQAAAVRGCLMKAGFSAVQSWQDLAGRDRVSGGLWQGAASAC